MNEIERLERDNAELRALFDLQWRRMTKATDRWRAEDPEARALIMPDLGDLLQWLMDDADRARNGGWYFGRCGAEREPDGQVCTADLYATPGDAQVRCPRCGAWQGVRSPGRRTSGPDAVSIGLLRRMAPYLRDPLLCNWDHAVAHALADWLERTANGGAGLREALATARALAVSFGLEPAKFEAAGGPK